MAYRWAVARCVVAVAMALAWTPGARAQRGQSIEDLLQSRIRAQPQQLQPYLDVANFYYTEHRFDEFDRTLANAIKMIRQAQVKAGLSAAPAVSGSTGAPRRIGFAAPPRIREIKPVYPPDALQKGVGGTVLLELTIDPRGLVSDARVTRSVPGLDEAALTAVRQWEFAPSFENATPASVVLDVRMTFIPESFVTVPQAPRRQIGLVLASARRYFDQGAYLQAEHVVNAVLAAGNKERTETPLTVAATTSGITTTNWPIQGGRDIKPPARTRDAQVVYPPQALQARLGGIVTINFTIDEQGKPIEQRRPNTTSPPILEQAVREAFQQWEFAPTTIAGAAVPVAMSVTFAFQEDRGLVEEVVRIGGAGEITEPRKIKHVPPRFPPDAQRQRMQGVIVLETVIDRDGKVGSIRILRSAGDQLDRAAVDAVRQWEFTPTKLYGVPVPVAMTVTVSFSIN
jgi:TonB family protein